MAGLIKREDIDEVRSRTDIREIVEGYRASDARLPLVVVGSAPYADEYTAAITASSRDTCHKRPNSRGLSNP